MKRYSATLTTNATLTIDLSDDQDVELLLIQGTGGNKTVTWVGVGAWLTSDAGAPTLKTTAGTSDLITFFQTGGIVYGSVAGGVGTAGAAGATGPAGINWRGAYSAGTTYATRDAVSSSGSSFVCILGPATGVTPGTDATVWNVLAAGGSGTTTTGSSDIVDNFVRANNTDISAGAPNGITYTKTAGTATEILSNALHNSNNAGVLETARCEVVMTSTDHHASVTIGSWTNTSVDTWVGPIVRYEAAANSGYLAFLTGTTPTTWHVNLQKITAGTRAVLAQSANLAAAPQAGDTIKLAVLGSALTAYYNGVSVATATDSTFTVGVRAGIVMLRSAGSGDATLSAFGFGT